MKLVSVQFMPGVYVTIGGKTPTLNFWSREKNGAEVECEEQKSGDIWLTTKDGRRRVVRPWAIEYTTYEPDAGPVKVDTTIRRGA